MITLTYIPFYLLIKLHKHEKGFNFLFALLSMFDSNIFAVTEHMWNQFFKKIFKLSLWSSMGSSPVFKILYYLQSNLHLNLAFLGNFRKLQHIVLAEHRLKLFYRTLSIHGNNFISHGAYSKQIQIFAYAQPALKFRQFYMNIQTRAEQTLKRFHRTLSMRGNDFIAC